MPINFSDRFTPLFELLEARLITESKNFKTLYPKKDQDYWLKMSNVDTVLISGGRDSGKTFALSCWNAIAARDFNHRILYTRQTMSSTDNSITEALENRMVDLGVECDFESSNKTYTLKDKTKTGKISITGQKTSVGTQTAKLKSVEDYSVFETDEGEELESYESWKKTKRSMRATDVQCLSIISFNPPTREHWLAEEFYEGIEDGFNGIVGKTLYIHTTYVDNGKENMASHNWEEYEELREAYELYISTPKDERDALSVKTIKKYKEHKYDILGGFKDAAEGVIYEDWEIGEFNESLPYAYGQDFGSSDPDATTKVAIDHNQMKIHIDEIHFKNNTGTSQLMQYIHDKVGYVDLIYADSASRRLIHDFQDGMHSPSGEWLCGVNMRKVNKSKGAKLNFVADSLNKCRSYTLVFTPRSINCIKAARNYVWHDKRAGVPDHYMSDLPDSWRYGIVGQLND